MKPESRDKIVLPVTDPIETYSPYLAYCLPNADPRKGFPFDPALIYEVIKKKEELAEFKKTLDGKVSSWVRKKMGKAEVLSESDRLRYAREDIGKDREAFLWNASFDVHIPIRSTGGSIYGESSYLDLMRYWQSQGGTTTSYGFEYVGSAASGIWTEANVRKTSTYTEHMWHTSRLRIPLISGFQDFYERLFGLTAKERREILNAFRSCDPDVQSYYCKRMDSNYRGEVSESGFMLHLAGLAHECVDEEDLFQNLSESSGLSVKAIRKSIGIL